VGQVTALGKIEREESLAGLHGREKDRHVRVRARVRLNVCVLGPEKLLCAVDRQGLDDIDILAAAIVALAGIALRVLVGQARSLRLADRARDHVLARDQLQLVVLSPVLVLYRIENIGIDFGKGRAKVRGESPRKLLFKYRHATAPCFCL
jgi:hypothetical protein